MDENCCKCLEGDQNSCRTHVCMRFALGSERVMMTKRVLSHHANTTSCFGCMSARRRRTVDSKPPSDKQSGCGLTLTIDERASCVCAIASSTWRGGARVRPPLMPCTGSGTALGVWP